ncbi:GNAT family N-acetyltransferase [Halobacillus rhizosphaerae]|uniref:GNAT family N-acetyltransferase n=1 Tax=Halobacillus rhizosphaerae TaxID=3064889 RepID=UPI00398B3634
MMEIQRLNEQDVERYLEVRLQSLQTNPEAFASSYEEEKERPVELYQSRLNPQSPSITVGAVEDGQLVGIATLVTETKQKLSHRANIVSTYVIPEKRGNNIGRKLIEQAIQHAQRIQGIEQIYLTVASENKAARQLYLSSGFEFFGTDKKALKLEDHYIDIDHMVLYF